MADSGQVAYTTSTPHYNDPYGYFVAGVSSCAGCTRATGLCLNMLGIPTCWQTFAVGLVLLLGAIMTSIQAKRQAKLGKV